ncbi:MAG TPA: HEAT repeat domain-containing protein [Gemmatimonadales bacterium]|nr:HEAT repeat domain-containing protein [Gemmatimonadales bacterium]
MRYRTPFACSLAAALLWGATLAAQAPPPVDEAVVGTIAHLLALSDGRQYDAGVLSQALHADNLNVRVQAAFAAGRIGDPDAVDLLIPALSDSAVPVQASAAFALGLLKSVRAVDPLLTLVRSVAPAAQGPREMEAVTALAKIGGPEGAAAIRTILESAPVGQTAVPPAVSTALLEAWRLGARAPIPQLVGFADNADETVRAHALYSLGRLRSASAAAQLLRGLNDQSDEVRAIAARSLTATLADSSGLGRSAVAARLRPLVSDDNTGVRINALRALSSFRRDSGLAPSVVNALTDQAVGVVVQAETTLGALGGSAAIEALRRQLTSPTFGVRRQAILGLAEADSGAGNGAASTIAASGEWRWRSVATEVYAITKNRSRLEALLADPDGRVVAAALGGLERIVPDNDTAFAGRARTLLTHADPAVRSVAADVLARNPAVDDIDRLIAAYHRAQNDPIDDARLSAVSALAAIADGGAAPRVRVVQAFVSGTPRPDDYLVRRLAAARLSEAADAWGTGAGPITTGKTDAEYRDIVRRYLLPSAMGQPNPQVTIETDRGTLTLELLPVQAPLTVAAFLALVDRRYFDGQTWHRVVPNFVVQAGDPRGDGWGGPGTLLRDELNPLHYTTGSVGMALSGPDTGGSQFFITYSTQPHLDGTYTIFGRVSGDARVLQSLAQGDRIRSVHR